MEHPGASSATEGVAQLTSKSSQVYIHLYARSRDPRAELAKSLSSEFDCLMNVAQ